MLTEDGGEVDLYDDPAVSLCVGSKDGKHGGSLLGLRHDAIDPHLLVGKCISAPRLSLVVGVPGNKGRST
jgi:hypothetical protein